ncbi:OstA-like protein [Arcticibacter svalbardensis]|uniref:OstA-like protein n=1 Tax=Arcticibacter svalbardensis TaxID=1288027 RepID=UPI00068A464C|nr:OstA-like protein [Arcticibacter svalbardensis]
MKKLLSLFILFLSVYDLSAQRRSQIQLTSSTEIKAVDGGNGQFARVINPVFVHDGSTLRADSSDYNQAGNAFDAYGHVVITQPDGTTIYSDVLNYNGLTKIAILTNNVRMIDKSAVLTTNHLTYRMASKYGTYIGGGKIENGKDVLTSQNGYYFATNHDAFFRFDVVVNTPDALIKTDTLKYNTESKIAKFFGPTTINGKGANVASKLYTENGRYNTVTDQAWFGKKNLYTEGSKSLKGDSLYYDGKAGMGKAINNITFLDTVQKVILKGNQGIYRKSDESALVTKNAYVVMQVDKDSLSVDSIYMTADTLMTKLIRMGDLIPANPETLKSDEEISDDPLGESGEDQGIAVPKRVAPVEAVVAVQDKDKKSSKKKKSSKRNKDSEQVKDVPPAVDSTKTEIPINELGALVIPKKASKADSLKADSLSGKKGTLAIPKKTALLKKDSVLLSKDASILSKDSLLAKKGGSLKVDSLKRDRTGKVIPAVVKKIELVPFNPMDTVLTRVIHAYHKVKIFKSDLQSRSDSTFYSYADSIIRCYINPIIWTQGTQLTADTIFLRLKNQKLDNMLLQNNGLIVSAEGDSTKFNQVKGKVLTGVFKDSKLESMFVDGNAESIYYTLEDSVYTGFNRSLSSRMRLEFADSKLKRVLLVRKPEGKYYPIEKAPKDMEILDGFIWKPKDRPKSKEEIIPTLRKKKTSVSAKAVATKAKSGNVVKKPVAINGANLIAPLVKEITGQKIPAVTDSAILKVPALIDSNVLKIPDSTVLKKVSAIKDSTVKAAAKGL